MNKPRLFVDRAFSLRGIGTVVTGTLTDGKLFRGDSVVMQPANLPVRIRSLQNHNREVAAIGPGTRAALNVPDLSRLRIAPLTAAYVGVISSRALISEMRTND